MKITRKETILNIRYISEQIKENKTPAEKRVQNSYMVHPMGIRVLSRG
jgi:hypothetical protein